MNEKFSYHAVQRYERASRDDSWEEISRRFCTEHGDEEYGVIADAEFDRLYDHLAETISKHASFADDGGPADFTSSRYVDQIPWIGVVVGKTVDPALAVMVALDVIQTAHRPLAVQFDYFPERLAVLWPNHVHSSFGHDRLRWDGCR